MIQKNINKLVVKLSSLVVFGMKNTISKCALSVALNVVAKSAKTSTELKDYVYDLKSNGMKPRKIRDHLMKHRPDEPKLNVEQIRYAVRSAIKTSIKPNFTYGELVEWLKTEMEIPEHLCWIICIIERIHPLHSSFQLVGFCVIWLAKQTSVQTARIKLCGKDSQSSLLEL